MISILIHTILGVKRALKMRKLRKLLIKSLDRAVVNCPVPDEIDIEITPYWAGVNDKTTNEKFKKGETIDTVEGPV